MKQSNKLENINQAFIETKDVYHDQRNRRLLVHF